MLITNGKYFGFEDKTIMVATVATLLILSFLGSPLYATVEGTVGFIRPDRNPPPGARPFTPYGDVTLNGRTFHFSRSYSSSSVIAIMESYIQKLERTKAVLRYHVTPEKGALGAFDGKTIYLITASKDKWTGKTRLGFAWSDDPTAENERLEKLFTASIKEGGTLGFDLVAMLQQYGIPAEILENFGKNNISPVDLLKLLPEDFWREPQVQSNFLPALTDALNSPKYEEVPGDDLPDVPRPPGSVKVFDIAYGSKGEAMMKVYVSSGSVTSNMLYYRSNMRYYGWNTMDNIEEIMRSSYGEGKTLLYVKDQKVCIIGISKSKEDGRVYTNVFYQDRDKMR